MKIRLIYIVLLLTRDSGLNLKTAVEISRDKYIDRNTEFSKLERLYDEFCTGTNTEVAQEQLKIEDNKLKDLQKELASLDKEESKTEKEKAGTTREIISTKNPAGYAQ